MYYQAVINSRAGCLSLVATRDPSNVLQHEKYIHAQQYAPGIEGGFKQGLV